MSSLPFRLASIPAFQGLAEHDLAVLEARLEPIQVLRGSVLVEEGAAADALYVVVSGRFAVEVKGAENPVAEIASGAPVGEIAFFAGGARTATVRAVRDSAVLRLTRADFDEISLKSPAIWTTITAALARRLAAETRKSAALANAAKAAPRPRTLVLVPAGTDPIPAAFLAAFARACERRNTYLMSQAMLAGHVPCLSLDTLDATEAFNRLEGRYDTVAFIAGPERTAWSEKVIRQADEVLLIATHPDDALASAVPLNESEAFALSLAPCPRLRLAVLHACPGPLQGTRHWLEHRPVLMHHHVALDRQEDVERLWRFIEGRALGLVACGGGAYCAAHVGLYKAFGESGATFDILGGTSGGAAMAAAFAQGLPAGEIDQRVHRMFIDGKAMQRYTLPRYSVLDHAHFDAHLRREYGSVRIEDLWLPYFAVSADLSDYALEVHRTGPLWAAIRASAAIPALLPPYYTDEGRMLVDGSVMANVPVGTMHALKNGPNVVVSFNPPAGERFDIPYRDLPDRAGLMRRMLNPFAREALPLAPSPATVLIRSLMANRNHFERMLRPEDWLLMPPVPKAMGALDWRRHSELMESTYRYTLEEIRKRSVRGTP